MADEQFLDVTAAVGTAVLLAGIVERVMAFIFEYKWVDRLLNRAVDTDTNHRVSRLPGFKALLALAFSLAITHRYQFDLFTSLFPETSGTPSRFGIAVTALVVAGGSAGAIALFQGYFKFGKETRDAAVAAANATTALKEQEAKQKRAKTALSQAPAAGA
jgi:hypothetical protein